MKRRIGTICECRNEILYNHRKCPHCGRKNTKYRKMKFIYISLCLLLFVTAVYCYALSLSEDAEMSTILSCVLLVFLSSLCLFFTLFDVVRRIVYKPKRCSHKFDKNCWCLKCGHAEHDWDGCKCRSCFRTRDDEHDWDGCKCRRCNKVRNEQHNWDGDKCSRCRKTKPS